MDPYTRQVITLAIVCLPGIVAAGKLIIRCLIDPIADLLGTPAPPPADFAGRYVQVWNINGHERRKSVEKAPTA